MNILAIETSCDETAAAVVRGGRTVLSNIVFSQADMHAVYGGVVPEIASRSHIESITGICQNALAEAGMGKRDIDAIAVTYAPGLIGALLVGVNFAKAAAAALAVPLIPVHHLRGHIAAAYLAFPELEPPFLALAVSGGHTIICSVEEYTSFKILGSTRDDAAGEAYDKIARVLGLGYPGGRAIDELSRDGDPSKYKLPRAVISGSAYDMSFSGLKTAVMNIVNSANQRGEAIDKASLAASFSAAVSDVLVPRAITAAKEHGHKTICVVGGVAANSHIRKSFCDECEKAGIMLRLPPLWLCGDNAAMIGSQAYYEYVSGVSAQMELNAVASLPIEESGNKC